MPLEILTIPCLGDNYAYAVQDVSSGQVALIDAPEAAPIQQALSDKGWDINQILLTHHHDDHIYGLEPLRKQAEVVGAKADAHRLPKLTSSVADGDTFNVGSQPVNVYDVSGHTKGHVAFHFPDSNALFSGDSLMVMGCGRLFEGDPAMMWVTLSKLMELPPETRIYSGHEYTASNVKFALSVDPENPALIERARQISETRAKGGDTMGPTLATEMATNPFLRAHLSEMKAAIGMPDASDVDVFAEIRKRKDNF
ncbi:MAG: hydroxyacylglutathione hydrolase [Paracoccaceae bacterium]|jgi:hydroxyacylglutathione hydrolase